MAGSSLGNIQENILDDNGGKENVNNENVNNSNRNQASSSGATGSGLGSKTITTATQKHSKKHKKKHKKKKYHQESSSNSSQSSSSSNDSDSEERGASRDRRHRRRRRYRDRDRSDEERWGRPAWGPNSGGADNRQGQGGWCCAHQHSHTNLHAAVGSENNEKGGVGSENLGANENANNPVRIIMRDSSCQTAYLPTRQNPPHNPNNPFLANYNGLGMPPSRPTQHNPLFEISPHNPLYYPHHIQGYGGHPAPIHPAYPPHPSPADFNHLNAGGLGHPSSGLATPTSARLNGNASNNATPRGGIGEARGQSSSSNSQTASPKVGGGGASEGLDTGEIKHTTQTANVGTDSGRASPGPLGGGQEKEGISIQTDEPDQGGIAYGFGGVNESGYIESPIPSYALPPGYEHQQQPHHSHPGGYYPQSDPHSHAGVGSEYGGYQPPGYGGIGMHGGYPPIPPYPYGGYPPIPHHLMYHPSYSPIPQYGQYGYPYHHPSVPHMNPYNHHPYAAHNHQPPTTIPSSPYNHSRHGTVPSSPLPFSHGGGIGELAGQAAGLGGGFDPSPSGAIQQKVYKE